MGRNTVTRCFLVLLLSADLASGEVLAQPARPDLARAERLLGTGDANGAWQLLSPHELALAGDEAYDYLLGVAALETGRADLATLILERVLAVNPNHAAARLDMGRAYFALGDFERARTEFDAVMRFDPPVQARATVERYRAAMADRTALIGPGAAGLALTGYVEAILGRDSNVNASTSQGSVYIPIFGVNFTLGTTSVQTKDRFASLGGGGEALYRFEGGLGAFAGVDARVRDHPKADAYDYASADYRVGLQYQGARDLVRGTVSRGDYRLDGAAYRRIDGFGLEWRRMLDPLTQLSAFGQESRIRYLASSAQSYSSNLRLWGATVARTLDEGSRTVAFAGFYRGSDVATDGRTDGDRRLHAVRAGAQRGLADRLDAFVSAALQKSTYDRQNALFSQLRIDHQLDLSAGLNWQWDADWLVRPQVNYTRADSNIPLNDYRRTEAYVTLRRDWR